MKYSLMLLSKRQTNWICSTKHMENQKVLYMAYQSVSRTSFMSKG